MISNYMHYMGSLHTTNLLENLKGEIMPDGHLAAHSKALTRGSTFSDLVIGNSNCLVLCHTEENKKLSNLVLIQQL